MTGSDGLGWPHAFREQHGRPPRVLHVGNIGNNAYLNARFLRRAGVECDVVSYGYYDRMATPEWEDGPGARPRWFVQGPFGLCAAYLEARRAGHDRREARLWRALELVRRTPPPLRDEAWAARTRLARLKHRVRLQAPDDVTATRPPGDEAAFTPAAPLWSRLLAPYDVVQAYATDPIWPLLAGKRPYVAFEHGTLRLLDDSEPLLRVAARAYRESDHTFVTNGDCLPHAERLGIPSFSPMIHPLDVERHEACGRADAGRIRTALGADTLLFCPMRHDWEIKGTDVHIRALPGLVAELPGRVVLTLCRWGADVERSRRLVADVGLERHVVWREPMNRADFIDFVKASDVVLDQMRLPHFDATAPQALASGVPVVGSYEPASTAWIVDEPAPIVSAFDEEDVVNAVQTALDPVWRVAFRERAHDWIHRHHHPRRLVGEHCRVYGNVLGA